MHWPQRQASDEALVLRLVGVAGSITLASLLFGTWAELSEAAGAGDCQRAEVAVGDTGTHGAVSGTGYDCVFVDNAGSYRWHVSWCRWVRVGAAGSAGVVSGLLDEADARIAADALKAPIDAPALTGAAALNGAALVRLNHTDPMMCNTARRAAVRAHGSVASPDRPDVLACLAALETEIAAVRGASPLIYADSAATGAKNGTSWGDAYADLKTAIVAVSAGDIVTSKSTVAAPFAKLGVVAVENNVRVIVDQGANAGTRVTGVIKGSRADEGGGVWSITEDEPEFVAYDY